jgi:hypothetical protein
MTPNQEAEIMLDCEHNLARSLVSQVREWEYTSMLNFAIWLHGMGYIDSSGRLDEYLKEVKRTGASLILVSDD